MRGNSDALSCKWRRAAAILRSVFLVVPILALPAPTLGLCLGDDPACLVDEPRMETWWDMQLVERRLDCHDQATGRLLALSDSLMDRLDVGYGVGNTLRTAKEAAKFNW